MKKLLVLILTCSMFMSTAGSNFIITFFFRQLPSIAELDGMQNLAQKLNRPGKIDKNLLNNLMGHAGVSGIFVCYAGYLAVSNANGQITFPRKHDKPSFNLLVTNAITPILISKNTVAHWEIQQGVETEYYSVEKKYDADSNTYFWSTQEKELPTNNIISNDTIIVLAKPKDIFVAQGITISDANQQLQMPDIFVRQGISKATNALYMLNIKNFFSPITTLYKKETNHYISQIGNE